MAAFVRERRESWERLEALAARTARGRLPLEDIEALDALQRRVSADLALARSRFPGTEAEAYLSQLLARVHGSLFRARAGGRGASLREAWGAIPRAVRGHARALGAAALLLAAGAAGGALAVLASPDAAALIVPDAVRAAVAAGRLWTGHLLSAAPGVSGAALAQNNVSAAALAFGLGALTAGLGTAALLLLNGLLLGGVAAYAAQGGLLRPFLGFVAAHGPLELSAFLLAAQAGFAVAQALVEPGEWPRLLAVQVRGREAARILAPVVPALALAALLEATVSPAHGVPGAAKAAVGLALAAALWGWLLGGWRARNQG